MINPASPLLTVVIPVYGVEQFLSGCLDSVLTEQVPGVEVLAIDDCSPDGSGAILDRYAAADSRVRVIHLTENVGLSEARNIGVEQALGDYLWFVDSDDWLPEGSVSAVVDRITEARPDVLVVDHIEVFEGDGQTRHYTPAGALRPQEPTTLGNRPELLTLMHSACTKIVRREYLDEIELRFYSGWYEDAAYSHPVLFGAKRIDTLDRICYCYRQRTSGGITKTVTERHFEVFEQYERMFAAVERLAGPEHEFAPELFRMMVDHLLVIAGNDKRLAPSMRRDFFRRAAKEYQARLPRQGYREPGGVAGLKHRLLRHNVYGAYAAMRLAYRLAGVGRSALRTGRIPSQPTRAEVPTQQRYVIPQPSAKPEQPSEPSRTETR